jgi:hypothetical protein
MAAFAHYDVCRGNEDLTKVPHSTSRVKGRYVTPSWGLGVITLRLHFRRNMWILQRCVRFHVFTTVVMESPVFWDIIDVSEEHVAAIFRIEK